MTTSTVTIISNLNQKGIRRDIELLRAAIQDCGLQVHVNLINNPKIGLLDEIAVSQKAKRLRLHKIPPFVIRLCRRVTQSRPKVTRDIKLFLELLPYQHLFGNSCNVFIPNPEWLLAEDEWKLSVIDIVACKSHHATDIFSDYGPSIVYLGFTSEDQYTPNIKSDRRKYLHIASGGHQKGTTEILHAWRRNPHWPELTVLAGKSLVAAHSSDNVNIIRSWVSDDELRSLMQQSGVHICCSNAEGFGHTIVEAMSCGALVITTDLAPMNELVDNTRGLLVPATRHVPMRKGVFAQLELADIENAVNVSLEMSDDDYQARCENARRWFLKNRDQFYERLRNLLSVAGASDPAID